MGGPDGRLRCGPAGPTEVAEPEASGTGGSGRLDTPTGAPSHHLVCSSQPPPTPLTPLPSTAGNHLDPTHGRQLPMHLGSPEKYQMYVKSNLGQQVLP
jgi:hypothetical protein